jgi:hypothetical protein
MVPEVGSVLNLTKKMRNKNLKKKVNTLTTGPSGPRGGKALPPVPVVPEVGSVFNLTKK